MKKKAVFLFVAIGTLLFLAGEVYAQAFLVNYALDGQGTNCSRSGFNTIALPYIPEPGLIDSLDLLNDIGGTSVVAQIARFDRTTNGFAGYTGTSGVAFNLIPAEGYLVQLQSGVPEVTYRIGGTHDPSFVVWFDGQGTSESRSGVNIYGPPYHSTAGDAEAMMNELGGTSVVAWIARFDRCTNSWITYTGTSGQQFPLEPAKAYLVRLQPSVPSLAFIPSHF